MNQSGGYGVWDDWLDGDIGGFREWFSFWVLFAAVTVIAWPFFFVVKAARLIVEVANRNMDR